MSHLNGHRGESHFDAAAAGGAVEELLAGRALGDLSGQELTTLGSASAPPALEASLDAAVGSLFLAMAGSTPSAAVAGAPSIEAVPDDVLMRLRRLADAFIAARSEASIPVAPLTLRQVHEPAQRPARAWLRPAMAAALLLGAAGWIVALRPSAPNGAVGPEQVAALVAARSDAITIPWGEWSDEAVTAEVTGVAGQVLWSDQAQTGVLKFTGLPEVEGGIYQLWIIDADRGMSQRISGAIFQGGPGQLVVPIEPRLRVNRAAAFAITIEQPGGTWVSDMTRRVVIAARPG